MATSPTLRRLLHPLYRRLETFAHPLRYLFVEITQRCNLTCRHCGSDCTRDTQLDELTTDEWLAFFAQLRQRVDPKEVVLIVTGGEPLCHPQFERILGGLKDQGLTWGLVSNGWALTDQAVRRLVEHGLWTATVSLDGLAPSHDWLRGKDGSFKRALAGIERLVAARLPNFDVVTCVNPRNLAELPRVYDLLAGAGVPAWRLFSIFPKGRAKENRELLLSAAELKQLMEFIRQRRAEGDAHGPRVQFSCEGYLPSALDREVRDEPYFCRAGISIGSVLCDGSISACPNLSRSLVQGNIRQDDFFTVWQERFAPFRKRDWMRTGACVGCGEWGRCQGNSLHLWDEEARHTGLCTFAAVTLAD